MSLLVYALVFYGLSYCIVYAAGPFNIFTKYREFAQNYFPSNLGDAVECMFCTPFQLGLIYSICNIFLFDYSFVMPSIACCFNTNYWFVNVLFDGAITASAVYLIDTLQNFLEKEDDGE